jgi:diguanylate cyclase (GGDEF)-like protein
VSAAVSHDATLSPTGSAATDEPSRRIHRIDARALVWLLGAGTATWLGMAIFAPGDGGAHATIPATLWLRVLAGTAMLVPTTILLVRRSREAQYDRELWRPIALAGCLVAAGFVGQTILVALGDAQSSNGPAWQSLPFGTAILLAGPCIYWGLVEWNRIRIALSDPADWLNGLTAVLAMVAVANLVVRGSGSSLARWPWWQLQAWLVGVATAVVLLGAAVTVAMLGRVLRDSRPWWICGALTAILVTQLASVGMDSPTGYGGWSQSGWLVAIAIIAWLSVWQRAIPPLAEGATTMSRTIGMMVVLATSAITLAVDCEIGNAPGSRLTAVYAFAAFAGASTQAIRIIRELSQLAQTRQEARTDELTGAANRRALLTHLQAAVASELSVCLLLVDLDRFKDVNDRHGHAIGDELLREVSRRLELCLPAHGLLARLGGDEFAVALETANLVDATLLADAILDAVSTVTEIDGRQLSIGASVGIAALSRMPDAPTEEIDSGELLRRADVAMYVAKQDGSGFSVYHSAVDVAKRERSTRLEELTTVLASPSPTDFGGELVVYYQAQLDADSREIVGAEALVRWQHPRLGLLGPDAFLDLAEDHGLMGRLTDRVLQDACAQAVRWRDMGTPLRVAVNVSTSSLSDPDLLPLVDGALDSAGLHPSALTLEITETTLMTDPEWCLETTRQIAARGIGVSIDDYGTGYSSLTYLSDLPATELKLDRSLTARVAADKRTAAIVAGTVELAHRLDLRLVAEGVEDEPTLNALRALHCDEVQGYLFGKPGPAQLLDDQLARPTSRLRLLAGR